MLCNPKSSVLGLIWRLFPIYCLQTYCLQLCAGFDTLSSNTSNNDDLEAITQTEKYRIYWGSCDDNFKFLITHIAAYNSFIRLRFHTANMPLNIDRALTCRIVSYIIMSNLAFFCIDANLWFMGLSSKEHPGFFLKPMPKAADNANRCIMASFNNIKRVCGKNLDSYQYFVYPKLEAFVVL